MFNRLDFAATPPDMPLLSVLMLIPLTAAPAVLWLNHLKLALGAGFAAALAALALSLYLSSAFDVAAAEPDFAERVEIAGLDYHIGLDSLNLFFIPLTAWLTLIALIHQSRRQKPARSVVAGLLVYEAVLIGAFSALNLLQFWLFSLAEFGLALFLVLYGKSVAQQRSLASMLISYWGSSLFLILLGFLLMAFGLIDSEHPLTFDWRTLKENNAYLHDEQLIFILLLLGFAARMPLFPFHGWLPRLLEHGSLTGVAFFLAGLKLGLYGVIRFILPLVPGIAELWAHFVLTLAAAGILYGMLQALIQINWRRLLAFTAVAHTGLLLIGLFSFNEEGLKGALLLAVVFGLAASALLYGGESVYVRAGTVYLNRLGDLLKTDRINAGVCFIGAAKLAAIPLIPPFQAGLLLLAGIRHEYGWLSAAAAGAANMVTVGILLKACWQTFIAPGKRRRGVREISLPEASALILAGAVLLSADFYMLKTVRPAEWSLADITRHYPLHGEPLL